MRTETGCVASLLNDHIAERGFIAERGDSQDQKGRGLRPHPAMHVTASLALGAAEQDETCNAVLLDGATYVCYAARVHALHP